MVLNHVKMIARLLLLLLALSLFCACPAYSTESHAATIKVVLNEDYPPFSFLDDSGKLQGILVDLWRLWERKTGMKADLYSANWAEAQRRMDAGEFQVLDAIFYSESRSRKYDFSPPYYKIDVPAFFKSEISGLNSPDSLRGFLVAVVAGDSVIDFLKLHHVTHLVEYRSYHAILEAAQQGKVVVFAADQPPALYYLYQTGLHQKFKQTPPLYKGELHRAYLKGSEALMARVEKGFAAISPTEMAEIKRKWLGSQPVVEKTPRYLFPVIGVIAGTLLLLGVWNLSLRRRVTQRTADLSREMETSNRRAEELRLSEASFRTVYDSVSEAIVIYDLDGGNILDVNRTMCEMFGLSREQARAIRLGSMSSGVPPYTEAEAANWIRKAGEGTPQRFPWQSRDRSGKLIWMEVNVTKARLGDKDVLLITLRDITDRKQGEEALRQSEEKYREIVENAPVGIFQSTLAGRFLSVNPALVAQFRFSSPREMIASISNIGEQIFVHPEQRRKLLESVVSCAVFVRREVEYRRKDGGVFSANLYMRAVRGADCEIQFLEGFVEDITERKRVFELTRTLNVELEQRVHERTVELEQANAALQREVENRRKAQVEISCLNEGLMRQRTALEAANKELETFSYSVSHDLRAPLRHICAFTEVLMEDCGAEIGEKARTYLEKISISGKKMQELIDGLLSLSRFSRGELNTVSLDLSIYAHEIASELRRDQPEREVTFVIADQIPALADPVLIRSVLENLIGNAWKYSSKNETSIIEFGYLDQGGERVYYVRDNGAGFDMTYADKLFGVFQRMHSASEFEGTGIGLATVQRIIHRHGGRIWAESEVGKGSTFYFTLASA